MRWLVVFFLCLPCVVALTPLEANTMEARVFIGNTVTFEPEGAQYLVNSAIARLTWFPRETYLQDITSLRVTPNVIESADAMQLTWENPGRSETFTVEGVVRTKNAIVPVRERIPFPLATVPDDLARYLKPGDITDQTPEIQQLAQELVAGKNDAYQAIFSLADWTTSNVEYNLASLGEPAIQTASQVLHSRWGKCDELTALFISLNRAVGVPARFVAGYSYTNSELFQRRWGGHGWAEVWLPEVGWIPFDVTYGEYGYLDAGHITLKISDDAKETSVDYNARGRDFSLQTEPLDITVTPLEMSAHTDQVIRISLDAPHRDVGFGSTVLILASVTNTKDYYVSTRLDLTKTSNTEMLSDTYENILLKPKEVRIVPFLVQIDDELQSGYSYEFPFRLMSRLGEEAEILINVRESYIVHDTYAFDALIAKYKAHEFEGAPYSITCDRATAYAGDEIQHTCTLHGNGQQALSTLEICGTDCAALPLADGVFTLTTQHTTPGTYTQPFSTYITDGKVVFFVTSTVVGPTEVHITTEQQAQAEVDENINIKIHLDATGAMPETLTVHLQAHHAEAEEMIDGVPGQLQFTLPGRALRPGHNDIVITATYVDELGTAGQETYVANVELMNVGMMQQFSFWLEDFGYWLEGLFS